MNRQEFTFNLWPFKRNMFCVSVSSEFGPGKENKGSAPEALLGVNCEGNDDTLKSTCLKRPRAETLPVKKLGRRSVRRRRCESPSPLSLVFQSPEPSMPEPISISEKPQAAEMAVTPNHAPGFNPKALPSTPETKVVACKQSMADESFSPAGVGKDHFNLRLEKQGKDSTIRKRLSTRLVHVPDVGEDLHEAPGYRKDSATVTTPVVFITSMPNDPKKRALAQVGLAKD